MMKTALTMALLTASPLAAQEFSLPQGCEGYVTVQSRGCTVSHLFRCEADPEGHQHRAAFTQDGMTYVGRIDAEAQWVESFLLRAGTVVTLGPTTTDSASLSTLLNDGRDTFDFETTAQGFAPVRHVGYDELTGGSVAIDGVELLVTNFEITRFDSSGNQTSTTTGSQFVSEEWGRFLSGISVQSSASGTVEMDRTPVDFIFPGEAGFLSSTPIHDCSVTLSRLEIAQ